MSPYDVLIIGGGLNGLACATLCAQAGRKVAVVESRGVFGGLAAGETFHEGYTSPGIHQDTTGLRPFVVDALDLKSHGLKETSVSEDVWVLDTQGNALQVTDSGEHLSPGDQKGLQEFNAFVDKARPLLVDLLDNQPRDFIKAAKGDWKPLIKPGLNLRRLGGNFMLELFRIPSMCAADWVSEFVEDERLRAHLAYDGIIRSFTGPWSPGTAGDLFLYRASRGRSIEGGPQAMVRAMEQAARKAGVTLLSHHPVAEILVEQNRATGIRTESGDILRAGTLVATCDPRHTLRELLDPVSVPFSVLSHIEHYRGEGIGAKVHVALKAPVAWKGISGSSPARVRIMDSLDALEKSFDPVRYGTFSNHPALDVFVPTVSDPSLAPEGHSVLSIWVHGVPHDVEGGWDAATRDSLKQAVMTVLEEATQGLRQSLVGLEILTPLDLADRYRATRGHVFHGDHALDQLLIRPIPQCSQYRTFLPGLYLGGSGSFPGGGLPGAPGVLCARRLLAD